MTDAPRFTSVRGGEGWTSPTQRLRAGQVYSKLNPEHRAALRESAKGMSFDRVSGRGAAGGVRRSISNHPTPAVLVCPEANASVVREAVAERDGDAADRLPRHSSGHPR
jgi:hypothetical protein